MKIISCENFTSQSATLSATATTDTIVKCGTTGKRYYWTGTAWKEYFEVSQGGNITITPLSQTLPKASVSSKNVIDTPYSVEPINNINLITGQITMPTANTYARLFIAPHTGLFMNISTMITNVAAGNIAFGIYSSTGTRLGYSTSVADSSKSNGFVGSSFWYDGAGVLKSPYAGVYLTGGQAYFLAVYCSSTTTGFAGFSGLPTYSVPAVANATQAYGAGSMPATLTLNGSNIAVFPFIKMELMQ